MWTGQCDRIDRCSIGGRKLYILERLDEYEKLSLNFKKSMIELTLSNLVSTFKLMATKEMLLMAVVFMFTGIEISFWSGVYSTCIAFTQQLGADTNTLTAFNTIAFGIGELCGTYLEISKILLRIHDKRNSRWHPVFHSQRSNTNTWTISGGNVRLCDQCAHILADIHKYSCECDHSRDRRYLNYRTKVVAITRSLIDQQVCATICSANHWLSYAVHCSDLVTYVGIHKSILYSSISSQTKVHKHLQLCYSMRYIITT